MVIEAGPIIDIGFEPKPKALILVVDDESAIHGVIFDSLEGDYRLISAFNGREGVEKAKKLIPSIILMDVMMPEVSGYEAVRLLAGDATTRHVPIVVMTAQNFDDSTIQLMKAEQNVFSFLPKPFRAKDLREVVAKAIERSKKPS